jgi:NAD(P)-dependent dehydrogenase (short-subunit alcohol dehydrogenase family)
MGKIMKTVLITGANSGIGFALAKKLIENGYFVIGTSRNGLIDIVSENIFTIKLDVTDSDSIEIANKIIREKFKTIDFLINNAGIAPDLGKKTPEINSFKMTFETNVTGLVLFTESIIDLLQEKGKILNISSVMGALNRVSGFDSPAYRMSKSAVNMYTKILSERLLDKNISVISIHPGWVKTKLAGQSAPLTPEFSANGIYNLLEKNLSTGTFWNAETQEEMVW